MPVELATDVAVLLARVPLLNTASLVQSVQLRNNHSLLAESMFDAMSCVSAGGSMPGQEEDISPYATFHLLGMREEVLSLVLVYAHY